MMPGNFSGSGDWDVSKSDVRKMVARLTGSAFVTAEKDEMLDRGGECQRHKAVLVKNWRRCCAIEATAMSS